MSRNGLDEALLGGRVRPSKKYRHPSLSFQLPTTFASVWEHLHSNKNTHYKTRCLNFSNEIEPSKYSIWLRKSNVCLLLQTRGFSESAFFILFYFISLTSIGWSNKMLDLHKELSGPGLEGLLSDPIPPYGIHPQCLAQMSLPVRYQLAFLGAIDLAEFSPESAPFHRGMKLGWWHPPLRELKANWVMTCLDMDV